MKSEEGATELVVFENQGYDNLKHRRAVFYVNKKFFVLVDEGIGNAEGTINLSFNLCEALPAKLLWIQIKMESIQHSAIIITL